MLKKIKIQIKGVHCKSCKTLIETEVTRLEGVKDVAVNYQTGDCEIEFNDQKVSEQRIYGAINKLDYRVKEDETKTGSQKKMSFSKRLLIAGASLILFALGYYLIQRFGLLEILSRLNEQTVSYWLILVIGLLASFHCVGMCGGLVVAYTVKHQAKGEKISTLQPHLQYNLGRLISYTVIGAILGGLGSFFGINPTFTGIIMLMAGVFMILMGLSFITNLQWLEKVKLRTPSFIAKWLFNQRHQGKSRGPFIIGLLNGLMPCGPLQAMQLYALASGSMTRGALSMGIYALGTIPLMFGFGSFISLISHTRIKQIIKVSGIIVIILGLFMLNRGLVNFGYGFRGAELISSSQNKSIATNETEEYQTAKMDLTYSGYSPNILYVKKDIPVRWIINVKQMSGCTNEILMTEYNINKKLKYGENVIEFLPKKVGEIKFSCGMKMVWGRFVVTENNEQSSLNTNADKFDSSASGCCSNADSCTTGCGQSACGCRNQIKAN